MDADKKIAMELGVAAPSRAFIRHISQQIRVNANHELVFNRAPVQVRNLFGYI
jgi:hypothetical protein